MKPKFTTMHVFPSKIAKTTSRGDIPGALVGGGNAFPSPSPAWHVTAVHVAPLISQHSLLSTPFPLPKA